MYGGTDGGGSTTEAAPEAKKELSPLGYVDRYYTKYRNGSLKKELAIALIRDTIRITRVAAEALLDDEDHFPSDTYRPGEQ